MTTLLSESEAGAILRLTPRQILKLAKAGQLPAIRLPGNELRFDADDLRTWIETRKQPATGATP